jgi:hypothetical protein
VIQPAGASALPPPCRLADALLAANTLCSDGAGMDEEDYIDSRMFEKGEDRLTDKERQKRQAQVNLRPLFWFTNMALPAKA